MKKRSLVLLFLVVLLLFGVVLHAAGTSSRETYKEKSGKESAKPGKEMDMTLFPNIVLL